MKKTVIKRVLSVAACVVLLLAAINLPALAYQLYTFPSNSQSGNNDSWIRYTLTDENAGTITVGTINNHPALYLEVDDGWYFDNWDTYFTGKEDRAVLSDPDVQGSNPVNDYGLYTFYNIVQTEPFYRRDFLYIASGTGFYGDHRVTAVLKPIVRVVAGDGVDYDITTNSPTVISDDQTAVKYGDNATVTYSVDDNYVVTSVSANYGTNYSDNGGEVSVNSIIKPVVVTIQTRLKRQTVAFSANGGSGTMSDQTFEYGVAQTLTPNVFTKNKAVFAGWNTRSDGSGTDYADGQSVTFNPATDGQSITLYARWQDCPAASYTAPVANTLTYDGTEQTLVTEGSTDDGRIVYALGSSTAPDLSTESSTAPTGADAGDYYVWYRVEGDSAHTDVDYQCIPVTVARKELEILWGNTELTYNGTEQQPEVTAGGIIDSDDVALTVTGKAAAVGNGYIATVSNVTGADKDNYKLPVNVSVEFNISHLKPDGSSYLISGEAYKAGKQYWFKGGTDATVTAAEGFAVAAVPDGPYANVLTLAEDDDLTIFVKRVQDGAMTDAIDLSEIVMFDSDAPTLEGIEDGKTYYGDLTVIKSDEQFFDIKQVTLDGQPMGFAEGTYGMIPADNKEHTVVVEDYAGNSTTYTVTVMKVYTVTFVADGKTVDTVEVNHGDSIAELPQPPAKAGYTVKWDKEVGTVTGDITVTAVYTAIPSGNPPTGNSGFVLLWLAVAILSASALGVMAHRRKRVR